MLHLGCEDAGDHQRLSDAHATTGGGHVRKSESGEAGKATFGSTDKCGKSWTSVNIKAPVRRQRTLRRQ